MAVVGTDTPRRLDADERAARRALRAERAQLVRWRRLLRARLDLTVSRFAPPEHLGEYAWDLLPAAQLALPTTAELTAAVTGCPGRGLDPVETMERLRALDRRLAAYQEAIDHAIEMRTSGLVDSAAFEDVGPDAGQDQD